jgi:hypothetical protein
LHYVTRLRQELVERNRRYAQRHRLEVCENFGDPPVACYIPSADGRRHGNFLPQSYRSILSSPAWKKRLLKPHSPARNALPNNLRRWMELDSGNSSDALLMNIFCLPGILELRAVCGLLSLDPSPDPPEFGFRARVPLSGGRADRTEVDMRVGTLLVEAKLTEPVFSCGKAEVVENYRDFDEVFDRASLLRDAAAYPSYQLIRNVLAAHASQGAFCLLSDARRPDLMEAWYAVVSAIRILDLRLRCRLVTWQEITTAVPARLRSFLEEKYGF